MTIKKEDVSSLVDNELSEFEEWRVLKELPRDEELRGAWERYHLIRGVLRDDVNRDDVNSVTTVNVSKAVAAAVARESTPRRQAPKMRTLGMIAATLVVVSIVATIAVVNYQSAMFGPTATTSASNRQATVKNNALSVTPTHARGPAKASPSNARLVDHNESAALTGVLQGVNVLAGNQEELR